MKKFYSILLAAVSLLFSANLYAETVAEIQDLIDAKGVGESVVITLTSDVPASDPIYVCGQKVTLDLGGHTINATTKRAIEIYQGSLEIIGTGTIEKTGWTGKPDAIAIFGSTTDEADFSTLTIGKDVTINAHGVSGSEAKVNAICVLDQSQTGDATRFGTAIRKGYAYGVKVIINGTVYGSKYGVKINGTINKDGTNLPFVHVTSTAEVYGESDFSNSTAIYSSGFGTFLIEGYVHGATAVFVKSGNVTLNDAVVKSDWQNDYNEPAARKDGKGKTIRSGFEGGGSAIVIGSQNGWPGEQEVIIKGDTKVTGASGYAIDEAVINGETRVSAVTVEGGTIEAGGQGAIVITKETADAENVVTIVGGNIQDNLFIKEGNEYSTTTAETFIPDAEAEGKFVTTTTTDNEGKTIIVITKLDDSNVNTDDNNSVLATAENGSIEWKNSTTTTETILADKTLTYLNISQTYAQTIIVGDADNKVTLTVGQIVLGANAQIIVNAGSKLVVTGDQGVYTSNNNNIVLRASDTKNYAQFLFSPNVVSNKNPKATIEWITDSYRVSAEDRFNQPFGIPTAHELTSIETDRTSNRVRFFQYDLVADEWKSIGYLYPETEAQAAEPLNLASLNGGFNYYQILCTSTTPGTKVTMKGQLVGNMNKGISYLEHYYMGFANSYTADMDIDQVLPTVPGANKAVYVCMKDDYDCYTWEPVTSALKKADYPTTKIAPMQAFVILNRGEATTSDINYKNFVWDPAMNVPASAPRRVSSDYEMLRVRVAGHNASDRVTLLEGAQYTENFDEGEAEKLMNSSINIYVSDEQAMGIFASNDVNNTYLGFACNKSGNYTLSFENRMSDNYVLVDLKNNSKVNIAEGMTYTFDADANENNDYRFQIVRRANMPTDVEEVETAVKGNGIYSLTGQYMGNMSVWNTLPAGVYVVDGVKRVK